MKINYKRKNIYEMMDILPGQTFEYLGDPHLRIKVDDIPDKKYVGFVPAVNFHTNQLVMLSPITHVSIIDAELFVNEKESNEVFSDKENEDE